MLIRLHFSSSYGTLMMTQFLLFNTFYMQGAVYAHAILLHFSFDDIHTQMCVYMCVPAHVSITLLMCVCLSEHV